MKLMDLIVPMVILSSMLLVIVPTAGTMDTIDVILIDGQSNVAYDPSSNKVVDKSVVNETLGAPSHKILYYGTETGPPTYGWNQHIEWDPTLESYGIHEMYKDGEWICGGLDPAIAYYYSQKTTNDIYIINVAIAGGSINFLTNSVGWEIADAIIPDALSKIKKEYSVNFIGWIMGQGEGNRDTNVDKYKSIFMELDKKLAKDGFKECYIALCRTEKGGNSVQAQIELAQENKDIHIATDIANTFTQENGLLNADNLHYTQAGRIVLAESIVEAIPETKSIDTSTIQFIVILIPLIITIGLVVTFIRNHSAEQ